MRRGSLPLSLTDLFTRPTGPYTGKAVRVRADTKEVVINAIVNNASALWHGPYMKRYTTVPICPLTNDTNHWILDIGSNPKTIGNANLNLPGKDVDGKAYTDW